MSTFMEPTIVKFLISFAAGYTNRRLGDIFKDKTVEQQMGNAFEDALKESCKNEEVRKRLRLRFSQSIAKLKKTFQDNEPLALGKEEQEFLEVFYKKLMEKHAAGAYLRWLIAKGNSEQLGQVTEGVQTIQQMLEKMMTGLATPQSKTFDPPTLPPEIFLGRESALSTLRHKITTGDKLLLLVNGQGGIGKTSLAAKYYLAYRHAYKHLAWLFAGSSVRNALLSLAPSLNITFPDRMPEEQRLEVLLKQMSNLEGPNLLVIDNANTLEDIVQNYQALRSCPNFHVMLTSRISDFAKADSYKILPARKS